LRDGEIDIHGTQIGGKTLTGRLGLRFIIRVSPSTRTIINLTCEIVLGCFGTVEYRGKFEPPNSDGRRFELTPMSRLN
jgi:hypothetical protein